MTSIADDKRRSKTYSPRIKESSLEALSLLTINMMRAFVLFAVLASVAAHDLTPDNYDELTNGKSVFIKFLAPVSASLFCFLRHPGHYNRDVGRFSSMPPRKLDAASPALLVRMRTSGLSIPWGSWVVLMARTVASKRAPLSIS